MKKMELTCVVCPNGCLLTVWQENGETGVLPLVSVRSTAPIPRAALLPAVAALKDLVVDAPVHIGDLIYQDPAIGLTLLASRNVERAQ